jgi:hypothetical protein
MSDLIGQGASWLASQLKASASVRITYTRGNASVEVDATQGSTLFDQEDLPQMAAGLMQWRSADWLVNAADLQLDGVTVTPARGDYIERTNGGVTHRFDVVAPPGSPPYRWSDRDGVRLRIHTKRTDET